jgi:murein DD-endopeptidase MepM/ murein hydrolase activator NlpD
MVALLLGWPGFAQETARPTTVTHEARAVAPGEIMLLTVTAADPVRAVDVLAFGHAAPAFPGQTAETWNALVGLDLDAAPGPHDIAIVVQTSRGRQSLTHRIVVSAKQFGVRRLTVDPRFVTPPDSALGRIEREQKRLAELLALVAPERWWRGRFVAPVDGAPASNFGQRSIFNGQPRGSHRGADFASPSGAPVRAPGRGRVILADDLYYSGNTVIVDHGLGLFSLLAHLSRIDVRAGDVVEQGAIVGTVGATGRVTGPHLHWTLRLGSAVLDPLSLLAIKEMPR